MSGHPLGDVVVVVQLGSTEEVGEDVVHSWAVLCANGEVVLAGNTVELTEQAGERLAARCLTVDDVDVGEVVHVEEHGLTCQQRSIGGRASNYGQELAPRDLSMRMMEVSVFRGVATTECRPNLEVLGPRRRVNRTDRQRRCGLEIEAESLETGI
jgi:hypothetical protein